MNCPSCGNALANGVNFCPNCGHKLEQTKPPQNEFSKYIPQQLQKKLKESERLGGMQRERRVVTILFCDLEGSAAAAEEMDPEEWTDIITEAFDHLIPPVYKYEGILARLMGDAILAFFGAPITHEDDPARAVLCGLDILENMKQFCDKLQDEKGIKINVRVGINTGLVIVGEIGSDLRVEYTAMGDAINLASRMESTAEPGTIQISQSTFKRVSHMFKTERLGFKKLKGKSEPVMTYSVLSEKQGRPSFRNISEFDLNFVGRDNELAILNIAFERLIEGQSSIISITGEAGLGKSRLVHEFQNQLILDNLVNVDNGQINWITASALAYQTSMPYSMFTELLNRYLGLNIGRSNAERLSQLTMFYNENEIPKRYIIYIATLLNIELSPEESQTLLFMEPQIMQEKTISAITTLFNMTSESKPTILVLDDIHWADPSSIQVINSLIKESSKNLLLILVSRTLSSQELNPLNDLLEKFDGNYSKISVGVFDNSTSEMLIANFLETENLPQKLRTSIIEKGGGNPFYIEEIIRSLIDSEQIVKDQSNKWVLSGEIANISLPENLNALILTRVDQLSEESKRMAQTASVIGTQFLYDILDCITDDLELNKPLEDLKQKDLILENSIGHQRQYFFKHVFSRDACYNSLLLKKRTELHNKVAMCLSQINATEYEAIGHHFLNADNFSDALPYIIKSAEKALKNNSSQESLEMFSKAKEIMSDETDFDIIRQIYLGLGSALALNGKFVQSTKTFHDLLNQAESKDNKEVKVMTLNKLASNSFVIDNDFEKTDELLGKAEEVAKEIGFMEGLIETIALRCGFEQVSGNFDSALKYEKMGMELTGVEGPNYFSVLFQHSLIISQVLTLEFDLVESGTKDLIENAKSLNHEIILASAYCFLVPIPQMFLGKIDAALDNLNFGLEMAQEIDTSLILSEGYRFKSEILHMQGRFGECLESANSASEYAFKAPLQGSPAIATLSLSVFNLDIGIKTKHDIKKMIIECKFLIDQPLGYYWGGKAFSDLGYLYWKSGNSEKAIENHKKAINEPSASMYIYRPYALMGMARVYLSISNYELATKCLIDAQEFIREKKLKYYKPELSLLQAIAFGLEEKYSEAEKYLKNSLILATALGFNKLIWIIELVLSIILKSQGRINESIEHLEKSKEVFETLVYSLYSKDQQNAIRLNFESIFVKLELTELI